MSRPPALVANGPSLQRVAAGFGDGGTVTGMRDPRCRRQFDSTRCEENAAWSADAPETDR